MLSYLFIRISRYFYLLIYHQHYPNPDLYFWFHIHSNPMCPFTYFVPLSIQNIITIILWSLDFFLSYLYKINVSDSWKEYIHYMHKVTVLWIFKKTSFSLKYNVSHSDGCYYIPKHCCMDYVQINANFVLTPVSLLS